MSPTEVVLSTSGHNLETNSQFLLLIGINYMPYDGSHKDSFILVECQTRLNMYM